MALALTWMRADAPYMPIVTAGLLSLDPDLRARWDDGLVLETELSFDALAESLVAAPLPDVDALPWPSPHGQALASSLAGPGDGLRKFAELSDAAGNSPEGRMLRALATDQVRRGTNDLPGRSRLLEGAKADLSPFRWRPRIAPAAVAVELANGPAFVGAAAPTFGLVPETHTFGGSVGRDPSALGGGSSTMLALLLRHGLLALPPNGARSPRGRRPGGLLLDEQQRLSWPVWTPLLDLRGLRMAYAWAELHTPEPDVGLLAARGIAGVYRSETVPLSDTVSVYRWGERVA